MKKRERGFTLIELLIVLIILGLVSSIAGPSVMKYLGSSKIKTAALQIKEIESALELYFLDTGGYPSSELGLRQLVKDRAENQDWNGPYFKKAILPKDPWGKDFIYQSPGEHGDFDLFSLGSDGEVGGEGDRVDISNWQG